MEIKLKAWNKSLGRMSGVMTLKEIHSLQNPQWDVLEWIRPVDGLDKMDSELWEGDIVVFINNSKKHIVKFYKGAFVLCDEKDNVLVYNPNYWILKKIGTIYENPELLSTI